MRNKIQTYINRQQDTCARHSNFVGSSTFIYLQITKRTDTSGVGVCQIYRTCDLMCLDDDRTVRREFNRQIDIPQNVDPKCLHSTLNKNGVLQVVLCFYRYNCTPPTC